MAISTRLRTIHNIPGFQNLECCHDRNSRTNEKEVAVFSCHATFLIEVEDIPKNNDRIPKAGNDRFVNIQSMLSAGI